MAVFRAVKNKNNPYLMVNKQAIHDPNLSAKATGILIYLLSRPDDWDVYENEIAKNFKDGRDSIRSGLKELIDSGYLTRTRLRDEGKFKGYEYEVHELPLQKRVEKPITENTTLENPTLVNPTLLSNESTNNDLTNELNNINIIVEYLNETANKSFRSTSKKTQTLIKSRLKEKFTVDDFKKVIDIKSNQWVKDEKMNAYLRPETLFGTKFESYLNEGGETNDKGSGSYPKLNAAFYGTSEEQDHSDLL